jgi:hypothetical protein
MKALLSCLLALCLAAPIRAQAPATEYAPDQLDQLVAPIALYPDPLIALILPASTAPSDVAEAAQYLASGGDPAGIESQNWDPSVKALAHYPEVVKWMAANPDWVGALGAAFVLQQTDVLKSVQQLRARARAAGTLASTPQQQVEMEGDDIRIVPAEPGTIYVPQYDPDVVYEVPEGYAGPFITFGVGFPVGAWLGYECDWDNFGIWVGPWHPGWAYRRDWRDARGGGNRWHADPGRSRPLVRDHYRPEGETPAAHFAGPPKGPARGASPGFHPSAAPSVVRSDYRGYSGAEAHPAARPPSGSAFGGYSRGTQTRTYSSRGESSRQTPVRGQAPSGGGRDRDRH